MMKTEGHPVLPVEIVLSADWWHAHEGIGFDVDFFYHPARWSGWGALP
jgi:hypothetical protein